MSFQFWNNKQLNSIDFKVGSNWDVIAKKLDNKHLDSIFKKIDNGDNKISQEELDLLNKIMQLADNQDEKTKNNGIIEDDESKNILKSINDGSAIKDLKSNLSGNVTNKTDFKNYMYFDFPNIDSYGESAHLKHNNMNTVKINVVYDELAELIKKNPDKTYKITGYERTKDNDGNIIEKPKFIELQQSQAGKKSGWSEGLDRNIRTIQLSNKQNPELTEKVIPELKAIGTEMGFNVKTIDGNEWLEDYSIGLNDGYRYTPNDNFKFKQNDENVINSDRFKSGIGVAQGAVIQKKKDIGKYANNFTENDIVKAKSYLEGGNVLNTCKADGTPAAVIGEDSLYYTLQAMGLDANDENIEKAKEQIANDLHLKSENITFIPQLDFHIDMSYRPLHNGEIAVPDYEEGIKILENTNISNMTDETKTKLIEKLKYLKEKTDPIISKTEENLSNDGYKITKVPCFSDIATYNENSPVRFKQIMELKGVNPINYMNGVGGTANNKNKDTFYITNTSGYPELDNTMKNYFKKIGIDKTFFVSTTDFLKHHGGIDCLTQEM